MNMYKFFSLQKMMVLKTSQWKQHFVAQFDSRVGHLNKPRPLTWDVRNPKFKVLNAQWVALKEGGGGG